MTVAVTPRPEPEVGKEAELEDAPNPEEFLTIFWIGSTVPGPVGDGVGGGVGANCISGHSDPTVRA